MRTETVGGVTIEIVQGDIASQSDVEAVINAANAQLRTGGGVAGAIHGAAGPGLVEEASQYAPIEPGEAVMTGAHELPNEYVIHCLGPRWNKDTPEDKLLASCYDEALDLAETHEVESVAFPALSTGAFGYPIKEATEVALGTVLERLDGLESVQRVRFVLYTDDDREAYEETFESVV